MITDFKGLHVIDTEGLTCFPLTVHMLLEFKGIREAVEEHVRTKVELAFTDDKREELWDKVKQEILDDLQNAWDEKETEIDDLVDEAEVEARIIENSIDDLKDKLSAITAATSFDVDDHV